MKFSVITITYNRAHLIGKTIQSVLNQTYQNFEHIIIDDGSTDKTEAVVNSFNDQRIRYYQYEKIGKLSSLRNLGLKKVTGEIISILDSDDLWAENKLLTLHQIFEHTNTNVIIHNASRIINDQILQEKIYGYEKDFYENVLIKALQNKVLSYPFYSFKKNCIDVIGCYDESMKDGQHDFFLRLGASYHFYYCNLVLAYKREHDHMDSMGFSVSPLINFGISLKKLYLNKNINRTQYIHFSNKVNYSIAAFYIEKRHFELGKDYLNKILKNTKSIFTLIYIKSFFRKLMIFNH